MAFIGGERVVVLLHSEKRGEDAVVIADRTRHIVLPRGKRGPRTDKHKVLGVLTRSGRYLEVSGEHVIPKVTE